MKLDAKKRIESIEACLRQSDAAIDAASADPAAPRRRELLEQYAQILGDYGLIEKALRRDRTPSGQQSLQELQEVAPLERLPDISRMLHTTIPGVRIVKLVVTQVFRIHDLLVADPKIVRQEAEPAKVLKNVHDANTLRRTLNRNSTLELPGLGTLRSVRTTQLELRDLWAQVTPELKIGSDPPIGFVPFEMTPLPMLEGFRPDLESIVEQTVDDAAGGARKRIDNVQVDSRLRLYSPGVGVVRIGMTVTFADVVYVEVVARIAREIEDLLLVGAANEEKNVSALLDDAVGALIAALFVRDEVPERRWRPPDVSFVLYDDGLEPPANVSALAHLVALSPDNLEDLDAIEARLSRVLARNEWKNSGLLAFAARRSALLAGSRQGARASVARRKNTVAMLLELQEVIACAAYVQQLFEEQLQLITAGGQLDERWGVQGDRLDLLLRLLRGMKGALQAVAGLRIQLEQHLPGILLTFAKQLWARRYRPLSTALDEQLKILSTWIGQQSAMSDELREVASLADQIGSFTLPFKTAPEPGPRARDKELETALLRNLDELESLVGMEGEADVARVQHLVEATMNIKARLDIR